MKLPMDAYSFRARVLPVYLTLAPAILVLTALVPEGLKLPLSGVGALVLAPVSFFASQVGADFGKQLEKSLWRAWGGPPTTRFLRHGNHEFNEFTRGRVHAKLRSLGLRVPTADEQVRDERSADKRYESCTQELIRRTRDPSKFPIVFKGLVEYGFRRNLLGLKSIGVFIAAVSVVCAALSTYAKWSPQDPPAISIVATLSAAGLYLAWLSWVTERAVKLAADRYARFIIEAALSQE